MSLTTLKHNKDLPAKAGGSLLSRYPSKAWSWLRQCFAWLLLVFFIFQISSVHSAVVIKGQTTLNIAPPESVLYSNDSDILRIENIRLYRYDQHSNERFNVQRNNLASHAIYEDLSQPATLLEPMPVPLDTATGKVLFTEEMGAANLPLSEAVGHEFQGLEPVFIVVKKPIYSPWQDAQGRNYISVNISVNDTVAYTVSLIETAKDSEVFVGYIQPNIVDGPVTIPPGSTVSVLDYTEKPKVEADNDSNVEYLADEDALKAPWSLSEDYFKASRSGVTSSEPIIQNQLFLAKTAQRSTVSIGDFVAYDLVLTNQGENYLTDIYLDDLLPRGFKYQMRSARFNGKEITPELSNNGRALKFYVKDLTKHQTVQIRYVVEVTAHAELGKAVNTAIAKSMIVKSNNAAATVTVESPFFNDRAFLVGRVIAGNCGESDAPGIENVRLYMEDGTNVVTDQHGRWHIEGVTPGTHVLQLDTDTLGPLHRVRQCFDNTRQAGNEISRFVNVQGGTLWRENWYIEELPAIKEVIIQQLSTAPEQDGEVELTLWVKTGADQFKHIDSEIRLPSYLTYIEGTTTLNSEQVDDIQPDKKHFKFTHTPKQSHEAYKLRFKVQVDPNLTFDMLGAVMVKTFGETVNNENFSVTSVEVVTDQRFVLRKQPSSNTEEFDLPDDNAPDTHGEGTVDEQAVFDQSVSDSPWRIQKEKKQAARPGFINLSEGMTFAQPVFSVVAQIDSNLSVRLIVNGEAVSESRIGMRLPDKKIGMTRYTWVGLELEDLGEYHIQIQGVDDFSNVRFEEEVTVRRSGKIKTVRLNEVIENIGDGRTPIVARLIILDEFDKPITSSVELEMTAGELRPLNANQNNDRLGSRGNVLHVEKDGIVRFDPVGDAGNYRISFATEAGTSDIDISVTPDLRDWILVGFAEGTIGYNTLVGNMQNLKSEDNHAYVKGDTSFFARGAINGEWLLTAAYDSRSNSDDSPLMHRIDPQKWYVLYGDDTLRGHDAPSSDALYLRIERDDFYALFGDYNTGLNVTELSQYQRTLTGLKSEYRSTNVSATGFAAQTDQGFIRDDIAADGTSGLYRLSQKRIIPGSDEVVIEVRDRFTNEIIETRSMTRYIDYNLDYNDGTLYFRSPLMVQDENFNPQRIVAKYEVESARDEIVAGGRVSLHDDDKKTEIGLSAINDDTLGAQGHLIGVDATWKPNDAHKLKAEVATSSKNNLEEGKDSGTAWLVEHEYKSEKVDTKVRIEQTDNEFGLGQIAQDDDDMRKALATAQYRLTEQWSVSGAAAHQKKLSNKNQRDTIEGRVEYQQSDWRAYTGLRHAEDQTSTGSLISDQVIAGAKHTFLDNKLDLSVRGETGISSSENTDYPSLLSFGSDYRLTPSVTVFANQDFTWGEERRAQETRAGVRATPWRGGTVTSEVSRAQNEYGPRLLAHAGLMQTVNITDQWTGDFGIDRSQTLTDSSDAGELFDDRRPTAFGSSNSDDYTAVYAGAGYRDNTWQLTNRLEYRHADTDDKWTVMSGFEQRLSETNTMAGRLLHFNQKRTSGERSQSSELDFSYAHRPLKDGLIWLNRTKLTFDALNDDLGKQNGRRLVNNTHLNQTFGYQHQVSMQYGARYVLDTIDEQRFTGYTDLIAGEYRYDITSRWDVGLRASSLSSYNSKVRYLSYGVMGGYSPVKNVWMSLGYNFKGFYDKDFDGAESRVKGFVLDFRIKFDQHSAKQWFDR